MNNPTPSQISKMVLELTPPQYSPTGKHEKMALQSKLETMTSEDILFLMYLLRFEKVKTKAFKIWIESKDSFQTLLATVGA
jgi:hypothetical protein